MEYVASGRDVHKPGRWTKSLHGMINYIERVYAIPFDKEMNAYDWFEKHVQIIQDERIKALFIALKPIQWRLDSSISSRQALVSKRFEIVNAILPFLNETEKRLVTEWKNENRSSGLWE